MGNDSVSGHSKKLSWLLRHGAGQEGIDMDAAGWVEIAEVRRVLHMGREALEAAVRDNDKARLQVRGTRIRACQGHSFDGMPVTREALEASWEVHAGDASLWHGTRIAALPGIAREGILPGNRTHAHLAAALDSTVGKRSAVDVMIEVSPLRLRERGIAVHMSPNGVLLVREVPPACIVGLTAMVDRARAKEGVLRSMLGVDGFSPPGR